MAQETLWAWGEVEATRVTLLFASSGVAMPWLLPPMFICTIVIYEYHDTHPVHTRTFKPMLDGMNDLLMSLSWAPRRLALRSCSTPGVSLGVWGYVGNLLLCGKPSAGDLSNSGMLWALSASLPYFISLGPCPRLGGREGACCGHLLSPPQGIYSVFIVLPTIVPLQM